MAVAARPPRYLPAADTALVVEFPDIASGSVLDDVLDEVLCLDAAIARRPPPGVLETVPAIGSLLVEYDPLQTSQAQLRAALDALLDQPAVAPRAGSMWRLPVHYGGDDGLDLGEVAERCGLTVAEVIDLHTHAVFRVGMLGNLPGLPYLTGLPDALRLPRRDDPRAAVPTGSVAVAAGMSCVYPVTGPGGWHVLGRTPIPLFDPASDPVFLLLPADRVRFDAVDRTRMAELDVAVASGWRPEPER
ncbi:MAG: allophanate hydrolase subunit 1 [Chloroflexi bacterium]|nr:MAG: allophanate hydrolase subunit 1 [Chloroflexota bacterium]